MAFNSHTVQHPNTGVLRKSKSTNFATLSGSDSSRHSSDSSTNPTTLSETALDKPGPSAMAPYHKMFTPTQLALQREGRHHEVYPRPVFPIQSPYSKNSENSHHHHHLHLSEWIGKSCHKVIDSACHLRKSIKGFCHLHHRSDEEVVGTTPSAPVKKCENCRPIKMEAERKDEWERYKAIQFMGIDNPAARRYAKYLYH